jgi:hypothetical protein
MGGDDPSRCWRSRSSNPEPETRGQQQSRAVESELHQLTRQIPAVARPGDGSSASTHKVNAAASQEHVLADAALDAPPALRRVDGSLLWEPRLTFKKSLADLACVIGRSKEEMEQIVMGDELGEP